MPLMTLDKEIKELFKQELDGRIMLAIKYNIKLDQESQWNVYAQTVSQIIAHREEKERCKK